MTDESTRGSAIQDMILDECARLMAEVDPDERRQGLAEQAALD